MNKILVEIKNVYGKELIYPVCNNAKLFARLSGKKTFIVPDLIIISQLGYIIETVGKTVNMPATNSVNDGRNWLLINS